MKRMTETTVDKYKKQWDKHWEAQMKEKETDHMKKLVVFVITIIVLQTVCSIVGQLHERKDHKRIVEAFHAHYSLLDDKRQVPCETDEECEEWDARKEPNGN
jgi:hypothetical protein